MALKASEHYRHCPTGQDEGHDKRREDTWRKVDEWTCARSIDHGALKSHDPHQAVKTKTRTKNSVELETVFRGSAACKPRGKNTI